MTTITRETFPLSLVGKSLDDLDATEEQLLRIKNVDAEIAHVRGEKQRIVAKQAADAQERITLIAKLSEQRDAYRATAINLCNELDTTPPVSQYPLTVDACRAFTQWFALGSSLAGVQNERFKAYDDCIDQLKLHAPLAIETLLRRHNMRRPKLSAGDMTWLDDLHRLKLLIGPHPTRIGNGG